MEQKNAILEIILKKFDNLLHNIQTGKDNGQSVINDMGLP